MITGSITLLSLGLEDGLPGAYSYGTSCQSDDPDATHINQFYHVECELRGGLTGRECRQYIRSRSSSRYQEEALVRD
jgi:hypothetical protein